MLAFEGNYEDYEADLKRRLGVETDQPRRIKYKKLVDRDLLTLGTAEYQVS